MAAVLLGPSGQRRVVENDWNSSEWKSGDGQRIIVDERWKKPAWMDMDFRNCTVLIRVNCVFH